MFITTKLVQQKFIFISFFFAGISAITYQVIWQRVLQRFVGTAITSVCLITAIFMAGLCLGALFAAAKLIPAAGESDSKSSLNKEFQPVHLVKGLLRIYLFSLVFLAALGFIYVFCHHEIFACLQKIQTSSLSLLNFVFALRVLLASSFLLLPASFIGMSLPILGHCLVHLTGNNNAAARLYQANLLGSAIGALGTCFVLLPNLGITNSIAAAAILYLLAAVTIGPVLATIKLAPAGSAPAANYAVAAQASAPEIEIFAGQTAISGFERETSLPTKNDRTAQQLSLIIVFFSGLVSFTLQMVFTRLFMLVFGSCSYAYALVLTNQLIALATGASLSVRFSDKSNTGKLSEKRWLYLIIILCMLAALWLYVFLFWLNDLPWLIFAGQRFLTASLKLNTYQAFILTRVIISFSVLFFPLTLLGMFFPCALVHTRRNQEDTARVVSQLFAVNTIGAICGCLIIGLGLMPALASISTSGIQILLVASSLCLVAFALYLCAQSGLIKLVPAICAGLTIIVTAIVSVPRWDSAMLSSGISFLTIPSSDRLTKESFRRLLTGNRQTNGTQELLYYQEGLNSTITVSQIPKSNIIFLKTNGKMEAALPLNDNRAAPTSDRLTHVLLGELPLLLSGVKPENVLLIGEGSGVTSGSVLNSQEVQHLNIAEPEEAILRALAFFRNSVNNYDELANALAASPTRASITLCDGRNFLSMLNKTHQVIIAQAGEPWLEGVADLYTLEFWQLARQRLTADGLFCQWLPLYGIDRSSFARICRTFQCVFPNTLLFHSRYAGEVLLVGFNSKDKLSRPLINVAQAMKRFQTPLIHQDLKDQGINRLTELLAMITFTPKTLSQYLASNRQDTINVDDQLDFSQPTLLASQGMLISPELYNSLKPAPFSAEELYCCYESVKGDKSAFIAQLAQDYLLNTEQPQSSFTAQALIKELRKLDSNK